MDNEWLLFDRVAIIRDTIKKYGEDNFYISFSGGKDSTILHYLVDMALPNNRIPRVFINTGIEYTKIVEFVNMLSKKDDRFCFIPPAVKPKEMLEKYGYPFKSKMHAHILAVYQNNKDEFEKVKKQIEQNPDLLKNYDFIHNLNYGIKSVVKYYYGIRERESSTSMVTCPSKLKYQFSPDFKMKISDNCCYQMKKLPVKKWQEKNKRNIVITGMRAEEGGMRTQLNCIITDKNKNVVKFHPLVKVDEQWEDWFIKEHKIELCELYKEPYNFKRTGCRFCPFSLDLQEQLEIAAMYLKADKQAGEILWKPVFDEYRRINYRLKKGMTIWD